MSSTHSTSDPPSIESGTQLMTLDLPTSSTIKKYKMEIQMDQPLDSESYSSSGISHSYRPGDSVNGEVLVVPPFDATPKDSIKFNEISISLQCKIINDVGGKTKTLFTMNDDIHDISGPFEKKMRFPFHFELPTELFDNTCPHNIDFHKQLPPSFASPRLCSLVFSGTDNFGVNPTECPQYPSYKDLPLNKFCVVYYITATINQKTHRNTDVHVIMKRMLNISVQNFFTPVPTNLNESSLDIANYYSMTDFAPNNELLKVQRTSLRKNGEIIGTLTTLMELPAPISISTQNETSKAQISIKFEAKDPSILPQFKYHAELTQFIIQSSGCVQPTASPIFKDLSVESIGDHKKVTIRGKTLRFEVTEAEWRPGYHSDGSLIKDIYVEIPHLAQQKLEPTFHSCTLQNIYILDVDIIHDQVNGDKNKSYYTQKTSLKDAILGKLGVGVSKNTCVLIHKYIQQHGGLSIKIPITLLC
ncbi:hypothetical protein BN7_5947 [Wickerhamomyces ciferrii]|uniref:Arrestin-like N-terminal domain-containing protein n=1 Tax=Wickerhamomyces ciferrii (strain ATCC 14091 / BCRC 22168 / CBS 111 / JCM 3599 / NBRC 0793 / NRRL Y-1031 F-60-10) TaxID=1206466 RepID=K0KY25_WICCF|nr:uncharacterized protein BN7_5947 [Wickerhamomyces ciferrii]CCH46354.1 hypothetical protein BN7_5947 [Wickerhamomyces ciferrii]